MCRQCESSSFCFFPPRPRRLPGTIKNLAIGNYPGNWSKESRDCCDDFSKTGGRSLQPALANKPLPLGLFHGLVAKGTGQGDGYRWHHCSACTEGICHSLRQYRPIEVELTGKQPDIEEILQPAVENAQLDHRLKFLGDGALAAVASQSRCRKIQNRRIFHHFRPGYNDIAETNIQLYGDAGDAKRATKPDAHT